LSEGDLTSIILKPEAEQRLGIKTVPVLVQKSARTRMLAGELLLPLGRVSPTSSNSASMHSIYSLVPAMTPADLIRVAEQQVEADGRVGLAQVRLDAAQRALKRAEEVAASKAGTQRAVDEAQAQAQLAENELRTAQTQRALLGAPIFETVRKDILWVRAALYAGDLGRLNRTATAGVSRLGAATNAAHSARPVTVPFSAASAPGTVDLFYELDNPDGAFRPGERIVVRVPLTEREDMLTVANSAVLYDIQGGTWVYERTAPHTFTRRRVELAFVSEGTAFLGRGPQSGAQVVTDGAAELFGTEFGPGK
jgi:multidrug efflux pump subunit AcrA (membrane-fusion protein)